MNNGFEFDRARREAEQFSQLRLEEQQRQREKEFRNYRENTSRKRLSRGTYVLIQFAVMLFLILALVVMYHMLH